MWPHQPENLSWTAGRPRTWRITVKGLSPDSPLHILKVTMSSYLFLRCSSDHSLNQCDVFSCLSFHIFNQFRKPFLNILDQLLTLVYLCLTVLLLIPNTLVTLLKACIQCNGVDMFVLLAFIVTIFSWQIND